eukprot:scaffold16254_cov69-Phaeocystis_antarctica.AAC.6
MLIFSSPTGTCGADETPRRGPLLFGRCIGCEASTSANGRGWPKSSLRGWRALRPPRVVFVKVVASLINLSLQAKNCGVRNTTGPVGTTTGPWSE